MNGPPPSGHVVRIVSYNVHVCIGRDRRFRPERIADVLGPLNADFIALQEIQDRPFEGSTVSDFLARRMRMHAHRGPTLIRGDSPYGNLLLSRAPAMRCRPHDLSIPGREPRGAIEADFRIGGRRLRIFVTHFGLTANERTRQVRMLMPALNRGDDTDIRILAGDINEWRPAARTLRALQHAFGASPAPRSYPARAPVFALDRIYVGPRRLLTDVRAVRSMPARIASDHLPLLGEIDVSRPGEKPR